MLAFVLVVISLVAPAPVDAGPRAAGVSPVSAPWRWPLRGSVGQAFAVEASRSFAAGQHRGVDLTAPPGRAVRAACGGRVTFAGRVARSGGVVAVRCGRLAATYLELGRIAVRREQRVASGAVLGAVGVAAHLHLGARDVASGRYLDPLTLLRALDGDPGLGPAPPVLSPPRRAPAGAPPLLPAPTPAPARTAAPAGTPALVWIGLGLAAAGLPAGGLLARRRTRHRARVPVPASARQPS